MEHYYQVLFNYVNQIITLPELGFISLGMTVGILAATMGMWLLRL